MTIRPTTTSASGTTTQAAAGATTTGAAATGTATGSRRRAGRWVSPVAAVTAALVMWLPLHAVVGLEVRQGDAVHQVGAAAVIVSSLVAGLGALGVAAVVRRRAHRPRRTFAVTALAVLVVSLLGPFGSATSTGAALALACLHLVVAAVTVPLVARTLPAAR